MLPSSKLYEEFLDDPESVPEYWRELFAGCSTVRRRYPPSRHRRAFRGVGAAAGWPAGLPAAEDFKQAGVLRLINAYRVRGHQRAELDPLNLSERPEVPDLELAFHNLSEADLDTEFHTGSLAAPDHLKLSEIIEICKRTYCGSVGVEYMHIADTNQRRWLQQRLERGSGRSNFRPTIASACWKSWAPPKAWRNTCIRATWARSAFRWKAAKA